MQFADILCYIFLTITVTASCSRAEKQAQEIEDSKRINKREATLILDLNGSPVEKQFQTHKVIYRRMSKLRHGPLKTKHGAFKPIYGPLRPKNRATKGNRKPGKKGRTGKPRTTSPKYGPPETKQTQHPYTNKKRALKKKPKYGVPKLNPVPNRPGFGHVLKMPHYSFFGPDKSGFGEPPAQLVQQSYQQSYGEPPVDSYAAPLKPSINDVYSTPHSFQESSPHNDIHDYTKQNYQWNHNYAGSDSSYAFTKKEPTYANFVTPTPKDSHDDSFGTAVRDKHVMQDNIKFFFKKKRPFYFADSKVLNKPWKSNKQDEFNDEIIVGGQYAEPPARFVPKTRDPSPIYEDNEDEDSFPTLHGYVDTDSALSANNSPYSNYKNSNMAFSPQNLNDAFSMVDK